MTLETCSSDSLEPEYQAVTWSEFGTEALDGTVRVVMARRVHRASLWDVPCFRYELWSLGVDFHIAFGNWGFYEMAVWMSARQLFSRLALCSRAPLGSRAPRDSRALLGSRAPRKDFGACIRWAEITARAHFLFGSLSDTGGGFWIVKLCSSDNPDPFMHRSILCAPYVWPLWVFFFFLHHSQWRPSECTLTEETSTMESALEPKNNFSSTKKKLHQSHEQEEAVLWATHHGVRQIHKWHIHLALYTPPCNQAFI